MTVIQQSREAWQDEKLIEAVAAMCRDAYIINRTAADTTVGLAGRYKPAPVFDGGKSRSGKEYKPVWPKIARFMLKHRLCPYVATQALFSQFAEAGRPPFPTHVASDKRLKLYRTAQKHVAEGVKASLMSNIGYARSRVLVAQSKDGGSRKDITARVILDGEGVLSDLFCYCLARSEGLDKLAEQFEAAAVIQFLAAEEAYRKHWRQWLPEDFLSLVRQVSQRSGRLATE